MSLMAVQEPGLVYKPVEQSIVIGFQVQYVHKPVEQSIVIGFQVQERNE
jgi:hypothetical protein